MKGIAVIGIASLSNPDLGALMEVVRVNISFNFSSSFDPRFFLEGYSVGCSIL